MRSWRDLTQSFSRILARNATKKYLAGVGLSIVLGFGTYQLAQRWIPKETWQKTAASVKSFFVAQKDWFKGKDGEGFFGSSKREGEPSAGATDGLLSSPAPAPAPSPFEPPKPKKIGSAGGGPGARCSAAEFRGNALSQAEVDLQLWAKVIDQFHAAKYQLTTWIESNRSRISARSYELLKNQMSELKIQRPPTPQAADLSWRGIGIYVLDSQKGPMLRIGGGLLMLVEEAPKRSQFEMTRLVAQVWAPCELKRLGVTEDLWGALLACLSVIEPQMCAEGSFSESGWAVASALAYALTPPACQLPVFQKEEARGCLELIGRIRSQKGKSQ